MLAEQCIGMMPSGGSMKLRMPNTDFFISPAYAVPPIRISFLVKLTATTVSLRVPWRSGSARKLGRSMIVNSGSNPAAPRFRPHEQGADEELVPGELVDHPHLAPGVPAASRRRGPQRKGRPFAKRHQEIFVEAMNASGLDRLVAVVPPDQVAGELVLDRELVLRAAAGVLAGPHDQRSVLREQALSPAHRILDQWSRGEVPEDLCTGGDALGIEAATRNAISSRSSFPFPDVKSGGGRCRPAAAYRMLEPYRPKWLRGQTLGRLVSQLGAV